MKPVLPATPVVGARLIGEERRGLGSLTRRLIGVAALWVGFLLLGGGYALDRVVSGSLTENFDDQLDYILTKALIARSEIDPQGEVRFSRSPADQRFLEAYSGVYFQISGEGADVFASPSLWDRRLRVAANHNDVTLHHYDSAEFAGEPLRIVERDVILPGSPIRWRFQVAQSREILDRQIKDFRTTLIWSLAALGLGLLVLTALQASYGLWPLRRVRSEVIAIRTGRQQRLAENFPAEVYPLVHEINELLAHGEAQAEEARRHAGNLAHALKTPLTVITNAATAQAPDLADTVCREATTMRRQVDHHLARARAIGRRSSAQARATVWDSLEAVERAVSRLYPAVTVDIDGDRQAQVRIERQDLDEMLGNLVENAAKYGGGRVFVTVSRPKTTEGAAKIEIAVEDDGAGIPEAERLAIFDRGARLDTTGKPGTGLGLAIVRDVAEIYGGTVALGESEDLGGLVATLSLPAAG